MTEQQIPAKFRITWKDGRYFVDIPNYEGGEVVRSDLADLLLKALEGLLEEYVDGANSGDWGFWNPEEDEEVIAARSALSAFRSATQDTEAR